MIANNRTRDEINLQAKRTRRQLELNHNKIVRMERDGDPRNRLPFIRDEVENMKAHLAAYEAELAE